MIKTRLKELAAKAGGTVKELGIFSKNRPGYDEQGNFIGMKSEPNVAGMAGAAAGAGAVGVGGVLAHRAVQEGFGNQGAESYKQAGRYYGHAAREAAGDFYANNPQARAARAFVKNKGRAAAKSGLGLRAGLRNVTAAAHRILRRFDAKVALRELAAKAEGVKNA